MARTEPRPDVVEGMGPPAMIPNNDGDIYIDQLNKHSYQAVGASSIADWVRTDAAGASNNLDITPSVAVESIGERIRFDIVQSIGSAANSIMHASGNDTDEITLIVPNANANIAEAAIINFYGEHSGGSFNYEGQFSVTGHQVSPSGLDNTKIVFTGEVISEHSDTDVFALGIVGNDVELLFGRRVKVTTYISPEDKIKLDDLETPTLADLILNAPTTINWRSRKFTSVASIDFNVALDNSVAGSAFINASNSTYFDFRLTGDVTFTLNGLDSGEKIYVILRNSSGSTDRDITWNNTIDWKPGAELNTLRGGQEVRFTLLRMGNTIYGTPFYEDTHPDITFPGLQDAYDVTDGYIPGSLGFTVRRNGTTLSQKTSSGDPSPTQFKVTKTDHTNLSTTLAYDSLEHDLGFTNVSFNSNLNYDDRVGTLLDFTFLGNDGKTFTIRKEPHFWKRRGVIRPWSNRSHYGEIKEDSTWEHNRRLYVARQNIATTDSHYNTAPDDDSSSARAAWEPQHLQDTHFRVDGNERGITFGERNNGNQVEMENLTILDVNNNAGRLGLLNREGGLSYVVPSSSFDIDDKDTWMKPTDNSTYSIDKHIVDVGGNYTDGYTYQLGDALVTKSSLKTGLAAELDGKMEIADLPIPLTHTHAFTFRNRSGNAYDFTDNDQLFYNLTEDGDGYLNVVISQNKTNPQPDFHNDLKNGAYISVAISDGEGGFDTNIYIVKDPHSTITDSDDDFEARIFRCKKLVGNITTQPSNGASVVVRVDFGVNLDWSNVSTDDISELDSPEHDDSVATIDESNKQVTKTKRIDFLKPRIETHNSPSSITPKLIDYDVIRISSLDNNLGIANPTQTDIPDFKAVQIHISGVSTARSLSFGTKYKPSGAPLPTTTTANKFMDIFIYKIGGKYNVSYSEEQ